MKPALDDGCHLWSADALRAQVHATRAVLEQRGTRVLATVLDNGADFVALDEAALMGNVVHVPLPLFFTPAQMQHALTAAGVDTLVVAPQWAKLWPELNWLEITVAGRALVMARWPTAPVVLPPNTAKITFTSGSTGTPKGVCLSRAAMEGVAQGLAEALAPLSIERHLNALPFAVLLENVAGLMAPRALGATVLTRPLAELGLEGAARFDAARFNRVVNQVQPHSVIVLPHMLRAWCEHLTCSGQRACASLKWVAVGGAPVGAAWIERAQALGLPVGEGYGLSEGASVQTLNLPGAQRPGSVGRALPHAQIRVAPDGELLIRGTLFNGYLADASPVPTWWPTGDLGRVDAQGFVYILGRKKNVLITAYGRNVSPEWVETELRSQSAVAQAVVLGDGQPALTAVLWPVREAIADHELQQAVDAANRNLPDYARIGAWVRGRAAFSAQTGLATPNGRPQRAAIQKMHEEVLQ